MRRRSPSWSPTVSFVGDESPPPFLPSFAQGQLEGAIASGIGYARTEEMAISPHGRVRNPTFFDCKTPAAPDLPRIQTLLVDSYEPTGPMGAESVAESGINAPIPTLANAIYDRLYETPFTPQRVLAVLAEVSNGG